LKGVRGKLFLKKVFPENSIELTLIKYKWMIEYTEKNGGYL